MQPVSWKRAFNVIYFGEDQTDLSLQSALTTETRTLYPLAFSYQIRIFLPQMQLSDLDFDYQKFVN